MTPKSKPATRSFIEPTGDVVERLAQGAVRASELSKMGVSVELFVLSIGVDVRLQSGGREFRKIIGWLEIDQAQSDDYLATAVQLVYDQFRGGCKTEENTCQDG